MEFTSKKSEMKNRAPLTVLGLLAVSLLWGCKGGGGATASAPTAPAPKPFVAPPIRTAGIDAGVPLAASNDPSRWQNLISSHKYLPRPDPFALHPVEKGFEDRQEAERLVIAQGGFTQAFEPEAATPSEATETFEPQPARRLAGVLVGDSVLAIIEMGNGRPSEIVRPGQRVPGTEWTVVSIDPEKAVLRRGGNKLPHEVVVRLESRSAGAVPRPSAGAGVTQGAQAPARPAAGGGAGAGRRGGGAGGDD